MSGVISFLVLTTLTFSIKASIFPAPDWTLYSSKGVSEFRIKASNATLSYNNLCIKLTGGIDAYVKWSEPNGYIIYQHKFDEALDLSVFDRIVFKADGGSAKVFVGFEDINGYQIFYGPDGADMTNIDFILTTPNDSKDLDVILFDNYLKDYPVFVGSERNFDFTKVKKIFFQISAYNGTSNVSTTSFFGCADMPDIIEPKIVSPNFDDVNDELEITIHTANSGIWDVFIESDLKKNKSRIGRIYLKWGRNKIRILPDKLSNLKNGHYKLIFEKGDRRKELNFEIDKSYFWDYSEEPADFDLACYVAGEKSALLNVSDYKAHFTKSFSQMKSWGLDAAIVLNPSMEIWDELVSTANEAGMKLILHLWQLDELILSDHRITEREFLYSLEKLQKEAQEQLEESFGFYLTDEPPESAAENLGLAVKILSAIYPEKPVFTTFNRLVRMKNLVNSLPQDSLFAFDAYPIAASDELGDFIVDGGGYKTIEPMDYADYAASVRELSGGRKVVAAIQAHGWQNYLREPTEKELSALSWIALSEGAKSLIYFLYMDAHSFSGLVNKNFIEKERVYAIKRIAEQFAKIKKAIDGLKPTLRVWLTPNVCATLFSSSEKKIWVVVNRDMNNNYTLFVPCVQSYSNAPSSCSITIPAGEGTLIEHKTLKTSLFLKNQRPLLISSIALNLNE